MTSHSKNSSFVSFVPVKQLNNLNDELKKLKEEKQFTVQKLQEEIAGMTTLSKHKTWDMSLIIKLL